MTLLTARWPPSRSRLSAPATTDGFVDHLHHAQLAKTRREWSTRGGVANFTPRKRQQGTREVKENCTFRKRATMKVVARFYSFSHFLTPLTTFQYSAHALNGNDNDKNGQITARRPKWQPGGPDDVYTRPNDNPPAEGTRGPTSLTNNSSRPQPRHFGRHGGATTQRRHVERHEAMENRAPPYRMTWRCDKPNAQCPPVEWHEGKSRTRTCRTIRRRSKRKPTIRTTRRLNSPPHNSNDTKERRTPPPTSNHTAIDGYWSRAARLCTAFFKILASSCIYTRT